MNILKYIYHDCFYVETPEADLVFDYWREPISPASEELPSFLEGRRNDKPLYVFVSHHHKDHFVKSVFGWQRRFPNIHYILSHDTARFVRHMLNPDSLWKGERVATERVTVMRPGDEWSDGHVSARAFGSTDIGCSYAVEIAGLRLFHAGDLNAWIWLDESTDDEVSKALGDFKAVLRDVQAYCARATGFTEPRPASESGIEISESRSGLVACRPSHGRREAAFDVAMFPVDDRMGREYWTGAKLFLETIPVRRFIPMHFAVLEETENAGAESLRRAQAAFRFDLYAPGGNTSPSSSCTFLGLLPGSAITF